MPKKNDIYGSYQLAIGASGTGTTFEAIAKAIQKGNLKMELIFLFCDRDCEAIKKAKNLGIKTIVRKTTEDINRFHERIVVELKRTGIDFVALAGYLRQFPITNEDPFLVLNSHPAAIPTFGGKGMYGWRVHQTVLEFARQTDFRFPYTFSTVHVATNVYDDGAILGLQKSIIKKNDTPQALAAALLPLEHQNYIQVLNRLSKNSLKYHEYPKELILPKEQKILNGIKKVLQSNKKN